MTLEFGAEVADVLADTSNDLVIRAADIAPHRKRRTGKGHKVGRSLHSGFPQHGEAAGSERKSAVRDDRSTTLKALGGLVIDDADLRTGEHDIGPRTEDGHRMTNLTEFVHTVGAVGSERLVELSQRETGFVGDGSGGGGDRREASAMAGYPVGDPRAEVFESLDRNGLGIESDRMLCSDCLLYTSDAADE